MATWLTWTTGGSGCSMTMPKTCGRTAIIFWADIHGPQRMKPPGWSSFDFTLWSQHEVDVVVSGWNVSWKLTFKLASDCCVLWFYYKEALVDSNNHHHSHCHLSNHAPSPWTPGLIPACQSLLQNKGTHHCLLFQQPVTVEAPIELLSRVSVCGPPRSCSQGKTTKY